MNDLISFTKADYFEVKRKIKYKKSNYFGFLACIVNLAFLSAGVYCFSLGSTFAYVISILLFSIQFNHSYIILHECTHDYFFTSKKANIIIGHIASIFSILPFYARKYEHMLHHVSTTSFYEPSTQRALNNFNTGNKYTYLLLKICWRLWIPIFSVNDTLMIWKISIFKKGVSKKRSNSMIFSTAFLITIYALLFTFVPRSFINFIWLIPAIYLYFIWVEFFNLPHHIDSKIYDIKPPIRPWEQYHGTKSCAETPVFSKWLSLNFNFHIAHHFYPNVPWYALKNVNDILIDRQPMFGNVKTELKENLELRGHSFENVFSKYILFQKKKKII